MYGLFCFFDLSFLVCLYIWMFSIPYNIFNVYSVNYYKERFMCVFLCVFFSLHPFSMCRLDESIWNGTLAIHVHYLLTKRQKAWMLKVCILLFYILGIFGLVGLCLGTGMRSDDTWKEFDVCVCVICHKFCHTLHCILSLSAVVVNYLNLSRCPILKPGYLSTVALHLRRLPLYRFFVPLSFRPMPKSLPLFSFQSARACAATNKTKQMPQAPINTL